MKSLTSLLLSFLVAASAVFAQTPAGMVNGKGQGISDKKAFRAALGLPIRVTDYGAVGDGMGLDNAVIVSGDQTVTCASANFPTNIAGKYARVAGGTTLGVAQVETATAAGTIDATVDTTPATLSVTVTGSGIVGSPITFPITVWEGEAPATWAAKIRGYLANELRLFDTYTAGGSTTSITLTRKRPAANDGTLNIAIAAGTNVTGFSAISTSANTTAGVATVDLITTVASRNSATSIELTAAPGRSGSNVTIYYGTNNTAAIEAAQVAAESTGAREVLFPQPAEGGCYLGNITGHAHIMLVGENGGLTEFTFDVGGSLPDLSDRTLLPCVIIPAVSTEPVIKYNGTGSIYGAGIKRLAIMGSKEQVGYGVQLGDPAAAVNSFTGGGFVMDQVLVTGFEYALSSSRVSQIQADNCLFLYSRVCVFLGELGLSDGPTDTSVFNSCGTGGAFCDTDWYINSCKGITINGGDHNDGQHIATVFNGSTVVFNGINAEHISGSPFIIATGNLTVNASKILHLDGPVVDAIGAGNSCSIGELNVGTVSSGAQWEGGTIACRTDSATFTPDRLPKGMFLVRYNDYSWTQVMQSNSTTRIYETAENVRRQPIIKDEFVAYSVGGAGPGNVRGMVMGTGTAANLQMGYGSLGWALTNLATDTPVCYDLGGPGNSLGVFGVGTSTSNASNLLRFSLGDKVFNLTAQNWEMRWVFNYDHSGGNIKFRMGAYDFTSSFLPTNGIGICVDRSVPDNTVKFEVINNSSRSTVETGIPYTALTSVNELVIRRTPQGYFMILRNPYFTGAGQTYPMVKHTANVNTAFPSYVAPGFLMGAAGTSFPNVRPDRFSLEMFDAY